MARAHLFELPICVTEVIYNYCRVSDLMNVACCNKTCHSSVKYLLWRFIRIPWKCLRKSTLPTKRLENLQFTTVLSFCNKYNFPGEIKWKDVAEGYEKILKHCHLHRLTSIRIDGVIIDKGIKLTFKQLDKLQNDYLRSRSNTTSLLNNLHLHLHLLPRRSATMTWEDDNDIDKIMDTQNLIELQLTRCAEITDASLNHICKFIELKKLTVSHNNIISTEAFLNIGKLFKLDELNMESTLITDAFMTHVCQFLSNLKTVKLSSCNEVTDAGFSHMRNLTKLSSLDISWCNKITDTGFSILDSFLLLQHLNIQGCTLLTDDAISHLCTCTSLRYINIGCTDITDVGISYLSDVTSLKHVVMNGCRQVTDTGLSFLSHLKQLTELDLSGRTAITDEGLSNLSLIPLLRNLKIQNCTQLGDVGLFHICAVRRLTVLDISGCTSITDVGVYYIRKLRRLEYICMNGCKKITARGLENLAVLTSLKGLSILNVSL